MRIILATIILFCMPMFCDALPEHVVIYGSNTSWAALSSADRVQFKKTIMNMLYDKRAEDWGGDNPFDFFLRIKNISNPNVKGRSYTWPTHRLLGHLYWRKTHNLTPVQREEYRDYLQDRVVAFRKWLRQRGLDAAWGDDVEQVLGADGWQTNTQEPIP